MKPGQITIADDKIARSRAAELAIVRGREDSNLIRCTSRCKITGRPFSVLIKPEQFEKKKEKYPDLVKA